MKVLFICGLSFGFCGGSEHVALLVDNFNTGFFPVGHEFAGTCWVGFTNFMDKSNKLSIHKDYLRETKGMRIPCFDMVSKKDWGSTLYRYTLRFSPGQKRFHTKPLSESQKIENMKLGFFGTMYSANQPLGKMLISALFKKGAKILGIDDPDSFGGHSLRALFLQKLTVNPEISVKETMIAARHNSVASQVPYITSNAGTETAKPKALGFKKPSQAEKPPAVAADIPAVEEESDDIFNSDIPPLVPRIIFRTYLDEDNFPCSPVPLSQRHGL